MMSSNNTQFSIAVYILVGISNFNLTNSKQLAENLNANPIFLKRIMAKLSKAGLISTTPGRCGGSQLSRKAEKISLYDVYKAVDMPKAFTVHDYPVTKSCKASANIQNVMSKIFEEVQSEIEIKLKSKTIADVVNEIVKR